jgi:hypothetical protein
LGSPILFASGGAMLVRRSVFLEAGGFDVEYFAYFEDVDFGWRLWLLGHAVAYAPDAVVRHIGGATGRRVGAHRRYTLWESNSLATVIKNYEIGNMERILSAALLLEYKRALMAAGDAVDPRDYELVAPKDTNKANVERLPKVSVAHLAAIDRLTAMLPHLMNERSRIQAARQRSDAEILPLMGRLYEPQFAGKDYAEAAAKIASAIGLFDMTDPVVPARVLLLCTRAEEQDATALARALVQRLSLAVVSIDGSLEQDHGAYTLHSAQADSDLLQSLVQGADSVLAFGQLSHLPFVRNSFKPVAVIGTDLSGANLPRFDPSDVEDVLAWCLRRGLA